MTYEEVRKLLLRRAKGMSPYKNATGVKAWCKANGVSNSHACEFLNGQRLPTSDLLEALGLEWRVMRKAGPLSKGEDFREWWSRGLPQSLTKQPKESV